MLEASYVVVQGANFKNSKSLTTKKLRSTYMSMLQEYLHFQGNATFIYIRLYKCRRSMSGIAYKKT